MRSKTLALLTVVLLPAWIGSVCFGGQDGSAPSAFFPQTHYEFSQVLDGAKVEHDFVVQNKGTVPLIVERVKTS